jgi:hypothetical protein
MHAISAFRAVDPVDLSSDMYPGAGHPDSCVALHVRLGLASPAQTFFGKLSEFV